MPKKTILYFGITLLCIIISLLILFESAHLPNERPNGFTRAWLANPLKLVKTTNTTTPLQKVSAISQQNIYFVVPNPQWIIGIDTGFNTEDTLGYGLHLSKAMIGMNNLVLDPPDVHLFANNVPALYSGKLNERSLDTLSLHEFPFTRSDKISAHSIIIRRLDDSIQKQAFAKINIVTGQVEATSEIITDQQPGGFESDGWLKYDKITNAIYYVEYYRNRWYCLDTTLKLIYKTNTIDTINENTTVIKLTTISDKQRLMPVTPRIRVNKDCHIDQGHLFVISGLKSDNEYMRDFKANSVVDVYDLTNGKYTGSFYIPWVNEDKLKSFSIKDNLLVALYHKHISIFQFDMSVINKSIIK